MNTDGTWEYYGRTNPYFGVLTHAEFSGDLSDEARARFFDTGRQYIDLIFSNIRDHLDPAFAPRRALDFGCGVGRLALPIARLCESVVGVDVSESMLEHARSNARALGIENALFVKGDDDLGLVTGTFDFLNSFIVFQHIPPPRGEAIVRKMISLLNEGGVGALQFTYAYESRTSFARRALVQAYTKMPLVWNVRNLMKGRPFGEPMMQMNEYNLNRLFRILQESGCHLVLSRPTQTGSFGQAFYGIILLFQKRVLDTSQHA
jgi:SAM-dependent methyltransferase